MKIETALTNSTQTLQDVSDSPRLDAELLLMSVLDAPRSLLFAHPDRELSVEETTSFMGLIKRRLDHEPVAYLTGEKEFWSLPLAVNSETLVPRPETELLVEEALTIVPMDRAVDILDLGTGSGAIAIALANERPLCKVVATDASASALEVAADNARRHGLKNIQFRQGDWLEAVADQIFDLIVSNPPYVARDDAAMDKLPHEPRDALVSGEDGLDAIRRIAADATAHLVGDGVLLVEHGADQKHAVAAVLASNDWQDILCLPDLHGLPRVTRATRGRVPETR